MIRPKEVSVRFARMLCLACLSKAPNPLLPSPCTQPSRGLLALQLESEEDAQEETGWKLVRGPRFSVSIFAPFWECKPPTASTAANHQSCRQPPVLSLKFQLQSSVYKNHSLLNGAGVLVHGYFYAEGLRLHPYSRVVVAYMHANQADALSCNGLARQKITEWDHGHVCA